MPKANPAFNAASLHCVVIHRIRSYENETGIVLMGRLALGVGKTLRRNHASFAWLQAAQGQIETRAWGRVFDLTIYVMGHLTFLQGLISTGLQPGFRERAGRSRFNGFRDGRQRETVETVSASRMRPNRLNRVLLRRFPPAAKSWDAPCVMGLMRWTVKYPTIGCPKSVPRRKYWYMWPNAPAADSAVPEHGRASTGTA